jgi:hypothetical protein
MTQAVLRAGRDWSLSGSRSKSRSRSRLWSGPSFVSRSGSRLRVWPRSWSGVWSRSWSGFWFGAWSWAASRSSSSRRRR